MAAMIAVNSPGIYRAPALLVSSVARVLRTAATILLALVSRLFAALVVIVFTIAIVATAIGLGESQPRRASRQRFLHA